MLEIAQSLSGAINRDLADIDAGRAQRKYTEEDVQRVLRVAEKYRIESCEDVEEVVRDLLGVPAMRVGV